MSKRSTYLLLVIVLALVYSCKKEQSKVPTKEYVPPGTYLLFDADQEFNTGQSEFPSLYTSIYYSNLDGTGITRITPIEHDRYSYRASWSPDGTQVLYTRGDHADTDRRLCKIDITGKNLKTITKGDEVDFGSFSPDGRKVAYAKSLIHFLPYKYDIYVANADGTAEQRLTNFAVDNGSIANIHWSADRKIYFTAHGDRSKSGVYSVNEDGSNLKYVMYYVDLLGISPDGKYILFDQSNGLFTCSNDGTNIKTLMNYDSNTPNMLLGASWSTDGTLIFLSNTDLASNQLGIFKINDNGYGFKKVLDGFYEYPSVY